MILVLQGVAAGALHVLTGPDHMVGVAPLAVDRPARVRPWAVGASWGLGHGLGVALLGVLGQTLLTSTGVEVASGWAERLVGVFLIGLGVVALKRSRHLVLHEHAHTHDGARHVHLHVHSHEHSHGEAGHAGGRHGHAHGRAAFGIGALHGLAGAGHFWAVLPSLAMTPPEAAVYIGGYLVASAILMAVFGAVLGRIAGRLGTASLRRFVGGVGVLTIVVGVAWLALALRA